MLAQLAVLCLLWTLAVGAAIWSARNGDGLINNEPVFQAVLAVAGDLADRPRQLAHSLHALDRALREGFGEGADAREMVPTLLVWRDDRLVYRSEGGAPSPRAPPGAELEHLRLDGKQWLARSQSSADGRLRVTLLLPDVQQLFMTFNSRGLYLVPMIISLPFLVLPAWWSVRVALRPWRRLSQQMAARTPADLRPLAPLPRQRELRPLVDALNGLLASLQASTLRERNLIADAAHALRTPLAAIGVAVETLQQQAVPPALMDNLSRSSARASRLVDQLLRLMRSEAVPAIQAGRIALDLLVRERLAALDELARARGVELACEGGPELWVHGEREGLESLVDNLVHNAIKYSPAAGIVTVALGMADGWACVEVRDQGPGIEAQWRERVFDRFFRAPDQSQSGSGLGLAIVRSVAQRHGGQVGLVAAAGGGLRAWVRLPLAPAGAALPARAAAVAGA